MASMRLAHMSRDEVMDRLVQLGWEPTANVTYTLLEKKSILHELEEKMTKSEMNDNTNVCAGLRQKNKTELRDVCKVLSIPLSGRGTKPQLTRKIKEAQAEREPLRQATLDFGRHRGKRVRMGVCSRQTVLLVGSADNRRGRCYGVATTEEVCDTRGTVTGNVSECNELTTKKGTQSDYEAGARGAKLEPEEELEDLVKRVEQLQAIVRQRKTTAKSSAT